MTGPHEHSAGQTGRHEGGIFSADHLAEHLREVLSPRTALICVGNELRGDDAAGIAVARELAGRIPWGLYDTQTVPESFLMKVVAQAPRVVILIDALHFGARPGAVELIEAGRAEGQGPSTHGPAPLAFLEVLAMFHDCRRFVLGIQPDQTEFGASMCEPVRQAVGRVVEAFLMVAGESGAGVSPAP